MIQTRLDLGGAGTPARVTRPLVVSGPGMLHAAYMPGHEAEIVLRPGDTVTLARRGTGPFVEVEWRGQIWRVHRANLDW